MPLFSREHLPDPFPWYHVCNYQRLAQAKVQTLAPGSPLMGLPSIPFPYPSHPFNHKGSSEPSWLTRHGEKGLQMSQLRI